MKNKSYALNSTQPSKTGVGLQGRSFHRCGCCDITKSTTASLTKCGKLLFDFLHRFVHHGIDAKQQYYQPGRIQ